MNSGMSPNLTMSSGKHVAEQLDVARALGLNRLVEAHRLLAESTLDDLLESRKGAAADEQDVRSIDVDELLVRVLAATLGRHTRHGALEDLEQRLLDPFARDVTGDGGVLGLARDLVDLVDVDDAALGALDVEVGRRRAALRRMFSTSSPT